MKQPQQFLSIIEREGAGYVALCPALDIASQGMTVEEARLNLIEAIELFFETADPSEVQNRLHNEVFLNGCIMPPCWIRYWLARTRTGVPTDPS